MATRTKPASRRVSKKPITAEDLLSFRWVSRPRISPDGKRMVLVRKHVGEKNDYVTNLWMVDTDGSSEPRAFTQHGKDSMPEWSPSGDRIAFVRMATKGRPQVHLIGLDGGEARAVTSFDDGSIAGFQWSPDGTKLAVKFRPTAADWTTSAVDERKESGASDPPWVLEDPWYRLDGDGYFGAQRYHLYLVDLATSTTKRLYAKDTLGSFDFDFAPDSKTIAVSVNRSKRALVEEWKCHIDLVDVKSGKVRTVPNLPEGHKSAVQWSPDGKSLAYAGLVDSRDGAYTTNNLELYVCSATKGHAKSVTGNEDYCLMGVALTDTAEASFVPTYRWAADSRSLFIKLGWHGTVHVSRWSVRGGKPTFLTSGQYDHDLGNVDSSGKRFAMIRSSATRLPEVYLGTLQGNTIKTTALTDFNREIHATRKLSPITSQWVRTADGTRCQVWTMMPPDHTKNSRKKYPAVLEIHGGPHGQYGVGFFHEFQMLAAAGYAVFFSNPRGSKGYGRAHTEAIRGAWGTADWVDMQAVIAMMKEHPNVKASRMGVMGGSYGGYMTNWIIGSCHDFAGAITDRCVSNLVSMGGNSDYMEAEDSYFPGNFWSKPEARWESSPIRLFGNVKTPTLIIHSEGDLRCNVEQSDQVYAALQLRKVPCRYVRYPRSTSHGMSRGGPPDMRLHRLHQILDWWSTWLS